ncbi:N-acetylmuramoyl-L-alanine amidase [Salinicoccus albus]|uniref:N-acetylmuramoyl-L-alanine amidase n=1 Tax=Salinicoccus albus TaxID=418756 RepID=UPI0003807829|nr:N-acetylmuramoyl-L-alanine amidase [Salinicoccus albus]
MSYKVVNNWVPSSKYNIKATYAMSPSTITVHNTANTASARNEVSYMRGNNNMTSYHVAIDDKQAVQAIPFNRNAWAAGDGGSGPGNRRSIHIEICYSMDNGYSGRYSNRHAQAEKNAAEYIAHILDQYGWGVNKLRQHYNWSGKDCPHKMRAWNNWNAFKNMVQGHLDDIKGGGSTSKPSTPAASGDTYKVRKGDTLWGIANANGVSVGNLKSWNGLSSNTISIGQTLSLKKSSSGSSSGSGTGGAGNIRYKEDNWNSNQYDTYYVAVDATFVVGNTPIYVYDNAPFINPNNRAPSQAKPGDSIDFFELCRQDGHVWGTYKTGSGSTRYMPIKKWNGGGGQVTSSGLWGKFV